MVNKIQNLVRVADSAIARAYLACFNEKNALITFLFHSLFKDASEIDLNHVDPLERTTVAKFRQLVHYYASNGYKFITPLDILAGLEPNLKYAMLTFDDGYRNNVQTLKVLEEFNAPCTYFISTRNVTENKCYWWDVLYREQLAKGEPPQSVYHQAIELKVNPTEKIEEVLLSRFGKDCLKPKSDIDRPFTAAELTEFARHPLVHLGNHTANHAILLNYSMDDVRKQIQGAQDTLTELTGKTPVAIAYPNGGHNDEIVKVSIDCGLKVGVTVRPHKTALPIRTKNAALMHLGRFCPHDESPMETQCRTYRSDLQLYNSMRSTYLRMIRKQIAQ